MYHSVEGVPDILIIFKLLIELELLADQTYKICLPVTSILVNLIPLSHLLAPDSAV